MFAAVGAAAPYLPVYYRSLGLTLDAIGLLAAVAALSALAAAPAWGLLADRFHRSRLVLPAACIAAAACAAALGLTSAPVVAALFAVLYALTFAGIGPILDARALETVADDQHRYGRLRVWGSASFVISTIVVGALIQATNVRSMFIVVVGALAATAIVAVGLRSLGSGKTMPRLTGLEAVLRNRLVMSFVAAVLVVWSASTAINGFLSIYLVDIGASETLVGMAWALGAAVEIPIMIAFPMLARRAGVGRLVLVGAGLLLLRAVAISVVRDPVLVVLTMALHGGGFALVLVGGVTYVARHAPRGAAATAQGVLSGVVFGLGPAIGPGIGGAIARELDLPGLFVVAAFASLAGLVGLIWAVGLRSDPEISARSGADTWR
jgi:PPP family 3-phenylpropionic acid transporter